MDELTTQLQTVLAEGKEEEARALVKKMIEAPLTQEERGAVLVSIASIYMKVMNKLQGERRAALEQALHDLDTLAAAEKRDVSNAETNAVRARLGLG